MRAPICIQVYLLTKYIALFVVAFESLQIFKYLYSVVAVNILFRW